MLKGLNCVLDLGAFIGDSACYLSTFNAKVYAYEPDKNSFDVLEENILQNNLTDKVKIVNAAVTIKTNTTITLTKRSEFDTGASVYTSKHNQFNSTVSNIHIRDVLKQDSFDGLKCDIEGEEWNIVNYLRHNPELFTFKRGSIEFHFYRENILKQRNELHSFLDFLKIQEYDFFFYNYPYMHKKINTTKVLHKIDDNRIFKKSKSFATIMLAFNKK